MYDCRWIDGRYGAVPKVVGLTLARARSKLARLKLDVKVKGGTTGKVTAQSLRPGSAAAPGLTVTLTVTP